ncbi:unnamed protein product [Schistosoma mattheei]|uniref:DUF4457 domain-containing protein n=1 Tax=Schistosoma mattheei TaxID=31246 RepID=A0AA85AW97_9TREM|nr:unnamed protein product [Schistosoma mattheei]
MSIEINTNYENYLNLLQERNKQRKLLNQKTDDDLIKERLEKGFQLYFNAATKYLKNNCYRHHDTTYHKLKNKHYKSSTNRITKKIQRKTWGDIYIPFYPNISIINKKNQSLLHLYHPKSILCKNLLRITSSSSSSSSASSAASTGAAAASAGVGVASTPTCKQNNESINEIIINQSEIEQSNQITFHLDVYNNWGDQLWIGLNGIEILLNHSKPMKIYPKRINIYKINHKDTTTATTTNNNSSSGPSLSMQSDHLFKSIYDIKTDQEMWITHIDHLPLRIEFMYLLNQFTFDDMITLNLWNYINSDLCNVGVKQCHLYVIYDKKRFTLYHDILPNNNDHSMETSVISIMFKISDIISFEQFHGVTRLLHHNDDLHESSLKRNRNQCIDNDNQFSDNIPTKFNVWFSNSYNHDTTMTTTATTNTNTSSSSHTTEINFLSNVNEDLLLNNSLNQIHMKPLIHKYQYIDQFNKDKQFKTSWNSLDIFNDYVKNRSSMNSNNNNDEDDNNNNNGNNGVNNDDNNNNNNNYSNDEEDKNNNNSNNNNDNNNNDEDDKNNNNNNNDDDNDDDVNNNNNDNDSSYYIYNEINKQQQSITYYPLRMSTKTISIPELPFGYKLLFDIISTWGDPYYVGLNGIEIFLSNGMNITKLCHITTNLSDESKMITNLIDGINWTKNDKHMWLTTFELGKRHLIEITLPKWIQSSIGLIRIWNYNKSYIDSYSGVKDLIIYLDNQPIFYNEIHKATGLIDGHLEDFCETILFSTDNNILNLIGQNDTLLKCKQDYNNDVTMVTNDELLNKEPMIYNSMYDVNENDLLSKALSQLTIIDNDDLQIMTTYYIEITLLEPWIKGSKYIGLTGIEFLDKHENPIQIKSVSLNDDDDDDDDDTALSTGGRNIKNLLNTKNHTTDPNDMWYTVYNPNLSPPILRFYPNINSNSLCLSLFNSIRIWNYNHRQIGYDYSCKLMNIKLKQFNSNDSILNELTILLRQAPGHLEYSFEQIIMFTDIQINYTDLHSLTTRYKYNHLPIGFVYQINIYSNWSNQFYVGLNGIQLLSDDGTVIPIHKNQIYAYPNSLNTLYSNKPFYSHICTVDKLVDNIITNNYNIMSKHCWLTSMIPNEVNKIFIVFHKPICIVGIRLWNYMRIPEYGVKEFTILIDDQLIFHGYLPKFQKDFDFKYDPDFKHDHDQKFDRKNNRIQINEQKLFWTNNEHSIRSSYSIVSFDKDILIKLGENPNCILNMHKSSKYNNNNNIKEIDMIHEPSNYSTYTSRLKKINQTPRPSTCVTDKERFKDQV